jgi:hypothetical protein
MWVKIDDSFEEHAKVSPLSDAAHRLWMRAACWCQKVGSDGFVPKSELLAIGRQAATLKRLEALAGELVAARAGGVFSVGLWEPVEGGWKFHDWEEYQISQAKPTMTRSEAASAAGKQSAKVRAERYGSAQPVRTKRSPNVSETLDNRSPNDVRRTNPERSEPPIPIPIPIRSEPPKPPTEPPPMRLAFEHLHGAWCKSTGLAPSPLGNAKSDPRIRAIAELYALGYSHQQLLEIVQQARNDAFCMGKEASGNGRPKGIEVLTPARAARLQDLAKAQADRAERQLKKELKNFAPTATEPRGPRMLVDLERLFTNPSEAAHPIDSPRRVTADELDRALDLRVSRA